MSNVRFSVPAALILLIVATACGSEATAVKTTRKALAQSIAPQNRSDFKVTRAETEKLLEKVDKLINKEFYNSDLAKTVWKKELLDNKETILESKNLKELAERMNVPIHALKCSHTQFLTNNEEIFYFLQSLFSTFNKKIDDQELDFTGITTGGVDKKFNCIRYVLNGSPADGAGLRRGDLIESVDGQPYLGQVSFRGRATKKTPVQVKRGAETLTLTVVPNLTNDYPQYVKAIERSVQIFPSAVGRLGYIHYWSGGRQAHDTFEQAVLSDKMLNTEGLIIDLRDGYGANSLDDLDMLYRQPSAYPRMLTIARSGKKNFEQLYYDKPVVVLINRGSRSGKELLAAGLKSSGRAKLVGETTAGFVLAGRLFSIDQRFAMYVAVDDIYLNGERLEGKGVSPDLAIPDDENHPEGFNEQLEVAKRTLIEEIQKRQTGQPANAK